MADAPFTLALDIVARHGKRPILIVVDQATTDYSIYELGDDPDADRVGEIVEALEREIEIAGEMPAAVLTDNSITLSSAGLQAWLDAKGIEHCYRSPHALVTAVIRQHAPDWAA